MPKQDMSLPLSTNAGKKGSPIQADATQRALLSPPLLSEEPEADLAWDEWDRACLLQDIAIDISTGFMND